MDNMGQGPSSPTWQASCSSCAAKITPYWIRSRSSAVCACLPTSNSAVRKVALCGSSTTAPMSLWGQRGCVAVSWWQPTRLARQRAASVTPARAWSTNSFSPICRKRRSPPPMWWPSTCIVAPLNRCLPICDQEQDPDRWCSHAPAGQEAWQIVSQWVWNLRLELGHVLEPTPMRTTEFAPPVKETTAEQAPVQGYGKPAVALPWKAGRFSGRDFALQPDGALSCPAGKTLRPTEQRREADGSLRVLYSARIRDCRGCPLRKQCQWHGEATTKPRRISVLLHPLLVGHAPLLWRDWSRRAHRRACMQLVRHQRIEVSLPPSTAASPCKAEVILSRAQRAHSRLSWAERLARNARVPTAGQVTIKLFGIPEIFAASLGLATV